MDILWYLGILRRPLISPTDQVIEHFIPDPDRLVPVVVVVSICMNTHHHPVASVVIINRRSRVARIGVDGVIQMIGGALLDCARVTVHESSTQFVHPWTCCTGFIRPWMT